VTYRGTCPCDPGCRYEECCGRYHDGDIAPDAQTLMRSRYSAYVLMLTDYLLRTWHSSTRPQDLTLHDAPQPEWLGLRIKHQVQIDSDHATVEFVARHRVGGRQYRLHEVSRFVREEGAWYYVDGTFPEKDRSS
jgi:SEC-C motif-containing protein